ncbi:ABC transporter permease [Solitalea lacus]|uniref:ABC transporter permease n=1 Tax=Solitalea lacus TaxID=2911172 RepID=UPI001EDC3E32|nr:FtsX-like permease family protein [Solitalea lacus]UKJ06709.1 ABC transporter permease [Solitalea lacus]
MMYLKLAWRNIWRNRRRTLITMASVFFAVMLSTLLMSLKEGTYSNMIDSMIGSYTGLGQVHAKGYWEEKSLDYSFEANEAFRSKIENTSGIKTILKRLEGVAMAASKDVTKVATVVGIDVKKESVVNKLNERVFSGVYLLPDDKAVMIGSGLAEYLNLRVNDTIVLLGQGYQGVSAAGKYPIKAIVKFGSPQLSKQLVFMPIKEVQWFYGMEGMINNLILHFDDSDDSKRVMKELRGKLGDEYEVMSWQELMPELENMIKTDKAEGYVFMFILYMVVSFGIFGTILMMLSERQREFGVLVSVGMKRLKLAIIVWLEVIVISLAGAIMGIIGALPVCYYFFANPVELGGELKEMTEEYGMEAVLRSSIEPSMFIQQASVILMISCFISIYPFIKLVRLDVINAIRS